MNCLYYGYTLQAIRKNKEKQSKSLSCQGNQPECVISSDIRDNKDTTSRSREENVTVIENAVIDKLTVFDKVLQNKNYV